MKKRLLEIRETNTGVFNSQDRFANAEAGKKTQCIYI